VQINPKSSRLEIEVGEDGVPSEIEKRPLKSISVYNQSSKAKLVQDGHPI
jgi:hypothetical protein